MRFFGRASNGPKEHEPARLQPAPVPRGAWYKDPFGTAEERWWDGKGWTDVVQGAPSEDDAWSQPRKAAISVTGYASGASDAPEEVNETHPRQGGRAEFPVNLGAVAGKKLRVLQRGRPTPSEFDVLAVAGLAGSLSLGGRTELARMACAKGAWSLKKRERLGWELVIESSDGQHVGWYSGRRWLGGGTISLIDGTQVDLRRSLRGQWGLQTTETQDRFVKIRGSLVPGSLTMAITIRSLPPGITEAPLFVLTACAVLVLERTLPPTAGG